jgi:hypothetical protein
MNAGPRLTAGMMEGQAPIAVVGLLAIAVIVAVHVFSRPPLETTARATGDADCKECGTVIAVRRSAHSVPVTFVEVQMSDGSVRTLRSPTRQFSVGDPVEVRDDELAPRRPS